MPLLIGLSRNNWQPDPLVQSLIVLVNDLKILNKIGTYWTVDWYKKLVCESDYPYGLPIQFFFMSITKKTASSNNLSNKSSVNFLKS